MLLSQCVEPSVEGGIQPAGSRRAPRANEDTRGLRVGAAVGGLEGVLDGVPVDRQRVARMCRCAGVAEPHPAVQAKVCVGGGGGGLPG